MERTGLPPEAVEDVLLGHCYPTMEAPAIGRVAALDAGLPVTASGLQIDRRCGSGLQAVLYAAMQVQSGVSDVVLAGGAESMSNAPFYSTAMRWGVKAGPGVLLQDGLARGRVTAGGIHHPVPGGMIETAENLRREYKISREEQDEYSVRSHQRAAAAAEAGRFADEIVPVTVTEPEGRHRRRPRRAHPARRQRRDARQAAPDHGQGRPRGDGHRRQRQRSERRRSGLRRHHAGEGGRARAAPAGAAGVVGRWPGCRRRPWASARCRPPPRRWRWPASKLADVDLIELNEAFASQVLAVTREWGFTDADFERMNVNGSGISLGHPVGATGGRILATLFREMDRRERPLRARDDVHRRRPGAGRGLRAGGLARAPASRSSPARPAGSARPRPGGWRTTGSPSPSWTCTRTTPGTPWPRSSRPAAGRWPSGADVGDADQVQAAVDRIAAELGPPVVLVNNAGVTRDNLLFKMADADWDMVMHVHLRGSFLMTRAAQKYMTEAKWGRIVNLSSTSALGNRGQANYSTAKAGLQGFTKTLAIELGKFGVTANAIAPGFIVTDMTKATAARIGQEWDEYVAGARRGDPGQPRRPARGHRAHRVVPGERGRRLRLRSGHLRRRRPASLIALSGCSGTEPARGWREPGVQVRSG